MVCVVLVNFLVIAIGNKSFGIILLYKPKTHLSILLTELLFMGLTAEHQQLLALLHPCGIL